MHVSFPLGESLAFLTLFCDQSGHLQNGKPAWRKICGKMGKKMEDGPRPEMAKKWPPKWKKWPKSHSGVHFSILEAIFWSFRAWGHFPFFPIFPGFCVGQVFHSVNGHSDRKTRFPCTQGFDARAPEEFLNVYPQRAQKLTRISRLCMDGEERNSVLDFPCRSCTPRPLRNFDQGHEHTNKARNTATTETDKPLPSPRTRSYRFQCPARGTISCSSEPWQIFVCAPFSCLLIQTLSLIRPLPRNPGEHSNLICTWHWGV